MPTGYTAGITDDTSLTDFAWDCARAFGALMHMRDDPTDSPISIPGPQTSYHEEALAQARADLAELSALSVDEAEERARAEYDDTLAKHKARVAEKQALRARLERLLSNVREWQPPTSEHANLKSFMENQLVKTIDFDCDEPAAPKQESGFEWLARNLKSANWTIEHHEREIREEVERARSRADWLLALDASLPGPNKFSGADA